MPSASVTPAYIDATPNMPSQSEHCVILMRGVVWRSAEVEMMKLWQNLLRFWPVTFADSLVQPQGALQAHGGGCLTSLHAKHPCLQDHTQDTCRVDMGYMLHCLVVLLMYAVCVVFSCVWCLQSAPFLIVSSHSHTHIKEQAQPAE